MKILIAEDGFVSGLLLASMLRELDCEPIITTNGLQAWRVLENKHYPIVICERYMPAMDGLELCRKIRHERKFPYTYTILLTPLTDNVNYLEMIQAGVDDFLFTPVNKQQLAEQLEIAKEILDIQQQVQQTETMMSICSYCKKIRNENNQWVTAEAYGKTSGTDLSHGVCPNCYETLVKPELDHLL